MSAAWHAFAACGRPSPPAPARRVRDARRPRPLHAERLAARGGPAEAVHDPLVWFDSSSYGAAHARLDAADGRRRPARLRLRPPGRRGAGPAALGDAVEHALTVGNPDRILGPMAVPA